MGLDPFLPNTPLLHHSSMEIAMADKIKFIYKAT